MVIKFPDTYVESKIRDSELIYGLYTTPTPLPLKLPVNALYREAFPKAGDNENVDPV